MHFIFTGFVEEIGSRVFAFDGVNTTRTRTEYTVKADLAAARKHGIRLQELPLLCRRLLDQVIEGDDKHAFTFTEDDMRIHSNSETAAAPKKAPWGRR